MQFQVIFNENSMRMLNYNLSGINNKNELPVLLEVKHFIIQRMADVHFEPEDDSGGNIEYKEYFSPRITDSRIEHLMTQMKWRTSEGTGMCIYYIGIADDGSVRGLDDVQYSHAIAVMNRIITSLGFRVHELMSFPTGNNKKYIKFTIHSKTAGNTENSLNVCFIGPHASGKSTLIAGMYSGKLDDGKGKIRHITHSHRHEILNGCTSSISETCIKNVSIYDLPGKKRYLKTMIRGLLVYRPHLVIFTVASNTLDPVISKIINFLSANEVLTVMTKMDTHTEGECLEFDPDFQVSAVTGQSVSELKEYILNVSLVADPPDASSETYIEIVKLYSIKGIGYIIYGMLVTGTVSVSDILNIGPFYMDTSYRFCPVILRSIHYQGRNVTTVSATSSQSISVGLLVEFGSRQDSIIYCLKKRRGDIMTSKTSVPIVRSLKLRVKSERIVPKKGSVYTLMYRNVKILAKVTKVYTGESTFKVNLKSAAVSPHGLTDKCVLCGNSIVLAYILDPNQGNQVFLW